MQIGSIISGERGGSFVLETTLGQQGMFGQVYLGYRVDEPDATERYAIKTLRPDRPKSDRDQLLQEIETLKCMQAIEESNNAHYAVRVIDYAPADAEELFIVMELASGQNVQTDIINVADWKYQPPREQDILQIAWHFAQALRLAHLASICYDDMKLENLFWEPQRQHPLRIIDWNVTSSVREHGVSGDWARFGACLYQLLTGVALGGSSDLTVLSQRPEDAPRWTRLSYGLQRIILRALHHEISNRYQKDDDVLEDLKREKDALAMDTQQLIEQGQVALERNRFEEARAWLARAEQKSPNRSDIATLRSKASQGARESQSQELQVGCQLLQRNEFTIALELLERVYFNSEQTFAPARRLAWLARFARMIHHDQRLYAELEPEMVPMIELLAADLAQASPDAVNTMMGKMRRMNRVFAQSSNQPELEWLASELSVLAFAKDLHAFASRVAVSNDQSSLEAQQQELAHKREELGRRATPLQAAVGDAKDLAVLLKELKQQLAIAEKQIEQHQRIESLIISAEQAHGRAQQQLEEAKKIEEQDRTRYRELLKNALEACDQAESAYKGKAAKDGIEQLRGMLQPEEVQKFQQVRNLRSKIDLYKHISDATIKIQQQQPFLQSRDLRQRRAALNEFDRVHQTIASLRANNPDAHQQIDAVSNQLDGLQAALQTARDLLELYDRWKDARTRQDHTAEAELLEQLQRQQIDTGRRGENLADEYQRVQQEANDIGNLLAQAAREKASAEQFLSEAKQADALNQREQLLAKADKACEQAVAFYTGPRGIEQVRGELRPEESRQLQHIRDTLGKDIQEARATTDELQEIYTQWKDVRARQEYQRALERLEQLLQHQITRGNDGEELALEIQRTRQQLLFQQASDIFEACLTQYEPAEIAQVLQHIEAARGLVTNAPDMDNKLEALQERVEEEKRAWERVRSVKKHHENQPQEYYKTLQNLAKQLPRSRWFSQEVDALESELRALFNSQAQALEDHIKRLLQQNAPYAPQITVQRDEVNQKYQALVTDGVMLPDPDKLTSSRLEKLNCQLSKLEERVREQQEQAHAIVRQMEVVERGLRNIAHVIQSSSLEESHKQVSAVRDCIRQLRDQPLTEPQRERLTAIEKELRQVDEKVALERGIEQIKTNIKNRDWVDVKDSLQQLRHQLSSSNLALDDIRHYQSRLEELQKQATQEENKERRKECIKQVEDYIQQNQYERAVAFGEGILRKLPDSETTAFRFEIQTLVEQAQQKQALLKEVQELSDSVETDYRQYCYQSALEKIEELDARLRKQPSDDPQVEACKNEAQRAKDEIEGYLKECLEKARQQVPISLESAHSFLDEHVLRYHPAYQPALAFQRELDEQILAQQFAEEANDYDRRKESLDTLQQEFWHADLAQRERSTQAARQIAEGDILFSAEMEAIEETLSRLEASLDTAVLHEHRQTLRQRRAHRRVLWLQLLLYRQDHTAYLREYQYLSVEEDIPIEQLTYIDSQYRAWQAYQEAATELQQAGPQLDKAANHIAAAKERCPADIINDANIIDDLKQRIAGLIQQERKLRETLDDINASLAKLWRPDYQKEPEKSLPELQDIASKLALVSRDMNQEPLLHIGTQHDQQQKSFVACWEAVANTIVQQAPDVLQDSPRLTAEQLNDFASVVEPFLNNAAPEGIRAVQQQVQGLKLLQETVAAIGKAQLQTATRLLGDSQQYLPATDDQLQAVQQQIAASQAEAHQQLAHAQQAYEKGMLNAAHEALEVALKRDSEDEALHALQTKLTDRIQEQQKRAQEAYALQATDLAAAVRLWDAVCENFQDGTLAVPDQPVRPLTDWRDDARQQLEKAQEDGKQVQNDFAQLLSNIQLSDWKWQSYDQGPALLARMQAVTGQLPDTAALHNLQQLIQYFHEFAEESKSFHTLVMTDYDARPDDWLERLEQGFKQFERSCNDSREKIEAITHELGNQTCEALRYVLSDLKGLYDGQRGLCHTDEQEKLPVQSGKRTRHHRFLRRSHQETADE